MEREYVYGGRRMKGKKGKNEMRMGG